jgi:hypothetical protein
VHVFGFEYWQRIKCAGVSPDFFPQLVGFGKQPVPPCFILCSVCDIPADTAPEIFPDAVYHSTPSAAAWTQKPDPFPAKVAPGPAEGNRQFNIFRFPVCVFQNQLVIMDNRLDTCVNGSIS